MNRSTNLLSHARPRRLVDVLDAAKSLEGIVVPNHALKTKRSAFGRPDLVWDGLVFLSTVALRHFRGIERCPDLDLAARQACGAGWGRTSTIIQRRFPRDYQFRFQGQRVWLSEHLKWGAGRNHRTLLRVAFAWLEDRQVFLIGYVGPHQRNLMS